MAQCVSENTCACMEKELAEKLQEQGGATLYATTLVNILWFQDTLDKFYHHYISLTVAGMNI